MSIGTIERLPESKGRFTGEEKICCINDLDPVTSDIATKIILKTWYLFDFNGRFQIGVPREELTEILESKELDDIQFYDYAIRNEPIMEIPTSRKRTQSGIFYVSQ